MESPLLNKSMDFATKIVLFSKLLRAVQIDPFVIC